MENVLHLERNVFNHSAKAVHIQPSGDYTIFTYIQKHIRLGQNKFQM